MQVCEYHLKSGELPACQPENMSWYRYERPEICVSSLGCIERNMQVAVQGLIKINGGNFTSCYVISSNGRPSRRNIVAPWCTSESGLVWRITSSPTIRN